MKKIVRGTCSFIARLIPVNKKSIVMASNPSIQDNTGALFNEMLKENINKDYTITWLIFDDYEIRNNYENCRFVKFSKKGKIRNIFNVLRLNYIYARSKYMFFSHDHNMLFYPKKNQRNINLTHGIPLKDTTGKHRSMKYVTDIITTSDYAATLKAKTNDSGDDKIRVLGYPRNDYLMRKKENIFGDYIMWLPTYRTHVNQLDLGKFDFFSLSPSKEQFKKLDEILSNIKMTIFIKPHPVQKIDLRNLNLEWIKVIDEKFLLDNNLHLYEMLSNSKLLITDYSSVYFDYLLTDNPIIFTFDDFERYKNEWGFTVDDVNEITPGAKVTTMEELGEEIKTIANNKDSYINDRLKNKQRFHKYIDDQSAFRLLEFLGIK